MDGPISGAVDTTRYRYDAVRQLIGVVSPDPDGAGALKHPATRITYNADGRTASVEIGTVNSQTDTDWAAFTTLQQGTSAYDAQGRLVRSDALIGGVTQSVVQRSYDSAGRLDVRVR